MSRSACRDHGKSAARTGSSTTPSRSASAPPESTSTNTWLDDGSILRIKLVLIQVWKVKEAYHRLRNPVYLVNHEEVMAVDAPDELREGG
jgi:hypothetical protein